MAQFITSLWISNSKKQLAQMEFKDEEGKAGKIELSGLHHRQEIAVQHSVCIIHPSNDYDIFMMNPHPSSDNFI